MEAPGGASSRPATATATSSTAATVDVVHEMSQLLDCGLDRRTVQILMALIDAGVHPGALVSAEDKMTANESVDGCL